MPDTLELPRMLRAVVELMGRERFARLSRGIVDKLVAFPFRRSAGTRGRLAGRSSRLVPGFAAIVGALDDLPEPAAGLGCVDAVRIGGRSFQVIHLPSREVRTVNLPVFAFAIGGQNKCAFARAYKNPDFTHAFVS